MLYAISFNHIALKCYTANSQGLDLTSLLSKHETIGLNAGSITMRSIIYIIVVILVISWLLGGFAFHVGGDAIHIIIVIAIVLFLLNIFNGGSRSSSGRWY